MAKVNFFPSISKICIVSYSFLAVESRIVISYSDILFVIIGKNWIKLGKNWVIFFSTA